MLSCDYANTVLGLGQTDHTALQPNGVQGNAWGFLLFNSTHVELLIPGGVRDGTFYLEN